jgi:hypothetical protein
MSDTAGRFQNATPIRKPRFHTSLQRFLVVP